MGDLAASDFTVVANPQDQDIFGMGGNHKVNLVTLTFGDGLKTYGAANGIPLPAVSLLGLHKQLKFAQVEDPGNGYVYAIDKTNHKLRIFQGDYDQIADAPLVEVGAAHAPAAS